MEYRGALSPEVEIPVVPVLPGLLTQDASGSGLGAILNQNGSLNGVWNPAARGELIVLFAVGTGQTSPAGTDGRLASFPLPAPVQPIEVLVGGRQADVVYQGSASGLVEGVTQLNARVPADVGPGIVSVVLKQGELESRFGVTVAVQ